MRTSTVCYAVGAEFSRTNFVGAGFGCSSHGSRLTDHEIVSRISYLTCGFGDPLLGWPESLQLFQGGDQFLKGFEFQNHNRRDKNQHDQA